MGERDETAGEVDGITVSGRVIATGPTADTLTPAHVRALYGVAADVRYHEAAGHLTVVPTARAGA